MRRINEPGLNLLKGFESFVPTWYLDAVDVRSIGWGHTGPLPPGFTAPLSEEEGERLLRYDLDRYEQTVEQSTTVQLTDNQYSALVSLCYNIGQAAFRNSTLLRRLNAKQFDAAADEFLRWVYAGGRKLRGLERRREAERALFLTPDPADHVDMAKGCEADHKTIIDMLRELLARRSHA